MEQKKPSTYSKMKHRPCSLAVVDDLTVTPKPSVLIWSSDIDIIYSHYSKKEIATSKKLAVSVRSGGIFFMGKNFPC